LKETYLNISKSVARVCELKSRFRILAPFSWTGDFDIQRQTASEESGTFAGDGHLGVGIQYWSVDFDLKVLLSEVHFMGDPGRYGGDPLLTPCQQS